MVGLVKDSDAAARKPFQWEGFFTQNGGLGSGHAITTVPANQRLVIEQVSAYCGGPLILSLQELGPASHYTFLPASLASGYYIPALVPVRFYVEPGADFSLQASNTGLTPYTCYVTVTGYFVDLP